MKTFKILAAVIIAGAASVLAVQLFFRRFYSRWKYYTLFDVDNG